MPLVDTRHLRITAYTTFLHAIMHGSSSVCNRVELKGLRMTPLLMHASTHAEVRRAVVELEAVT